MAKKIALAALTLALVVSWGVLPAMACDNTVQIKQAEELLKKAQIQEKSAETKALIGEAGKVLSGGPPHEGAKAVSAPKAKSAHELAEEIERLTRWP